MLKREMFEDWVWDGILEASLYWLGRISYLVLAALFGFVCLASVVSLTLGELAQAGEGRLEVIIAAIHPVWGPGREIVGGVTAFYLAYMFGLRGLKERWDRFSVGASLVGVGYLIGSMITETLYVA